MKTKRGQGLSLNVIIISAIALIVLVVLVMIFTGRMGVFTGGINKCANQGGECGTDEATCRAAGGVPMKASDCPNECCIPKQS